MKSVKAVWVTGAGSKNGLGYAVGEAVEKKGYKAVRLDRAFGEGIQGVRLDITDNKAVDRLFHDISDADVPVAIVNCAGVNITGKFIDYTIGDVKKTFEVNVFGMFNVIQAYVKRAKDIEAPKYIINIGSDSANTPRTNSFAYCASKAAVQMFTRSFARDLAADGFRTIEIDPSLIEKTDMDSYINSEAARLSGQTEDQIWKYRLSKVPLGRASTPEEIAVWVPFLIEHGEYANGSCIRVTGGVI